LLEKEK